MNKITISLEQTDHLQALSNAHTVDDFMRVMFGVLKSRYVEDSRTGTFYDRQKYRPLEDAEQQSLLNKTWHIDGKKSQVHKTFRQSLSCLDIDDDSFLTRFIYDFSRDYNSFTDRGFNARPRLPSEYPEAPETPQLKAAVKIAWDYLESRFAKSEEGKKLFHWYLTFLYALGTKGHRPPIGPVIVGEKGSGKGLTFRLAQLMVGIDCFQDVGDTIFNGNFLPPNAAYCRLMGSNDFSIKGKTQTERSNQFEHVKNLQKDLTAPLESKGKDAKNFDPQFTLFFTSNKDDLPTEFVSDRNFIVIPFNNVDLDPETQEPSAPQEVLSLYRDNQVLGQPLDRIGFAQYFLKFIDAYLKNNGIPRNMYNFKIKTAKEAEIVDNVTLSDPILAHLLDIVEIGKEYTAQQLLDLVLLSATLMPKTKEGLTVKSLGKRLQKIVTQGRYCTCRIIDTKNKTKGYTFKNLGDDVNDDGDDESDVNKLSREPIGPCPYANKCKNCNGQNGQKCALWDVCQSPDKFPDEFTDLISLLTTD